MLKRLLATVAVGAMVNMAYAAPTIDGTLDAAEYGDPLTSSTEVNSFGGGHSLDAVYVAQDETNLYIFIEGNSSYGNALDLFIDVSDVAGDSAAPVPSSSGGGGALNGADLVGATFDLSEIDFGFAGNSDDDNAGDSGAHSFYVDAVDYTDDATPNAAQYLGLDAVVNGATDASHSTGTLTTTVGTGEYAFAYSDNDGAGTGTGNVEGFELAIAKSSLGITPTSQASVFVAFTGGSGYFSNQVLPPVIGQTANIGTDPNFTTIDSAPQYVGFQVPVELSSFSAE